MSSSLARRVARAGGILLLGALLAWPVSLSAEERRGGEQAGNAPPAGHFIAYLSPARPGAAATEEEKGRITRHFDYLKTLQSEGKLVLAGVRTDDYQEIVVIRAGDRLEAEKILFSDPAVGGNVLRAEIHPFMLVFPQGGK